VRTTHDYLCVVRGISLSERRDFQAALHLLKVERHQPILSNTTIPLAANRYMPTSGCDWTITTERRRVLHPELSAALESSAAGGAYACLGHVPEDLRVRSMATAMKIGASMSMGIWWLLVWGPPVRAPCPCLHRLAAGPAAHRRNDRSGTGSGDAVLLGVMT